MRKKLALLYYDFLGHQLDAMVESSQKKKHAVVEITRLTGNQGSNVLILGLPPTCSLASAMPFILSVPWFP